VIITETSSEALGSSILRGDNHKLDKPPSIGIIILLYMVIR